MFYIFERFIAITSALDERTVMAITAATAIMSIIIAFFALLTTIVQGIQNHRRNKIQVRPFLGASTQMHVSGDVGRYEFKLTNRGVGPAIIKKSILLFDSEVISQNDYQNYVDFLKAKLKKYRSMQVGFVVPDRIMKADEEQMIWSFEYEIQNQNLSFLDKLALVVEYQSIYEDETFVFDSRDNRNFSR